ncbi:MAG: AraC family transcriptional regulator [bacterium]|nr:AraC family transcriptional regulator [bacterium]
MNTIRIKNMVCARCIVSVKESFDKSEIETTSVELGEVVTKEPLSPLQLELVSKDLTANGFEIIDDRKSQILEKIKTLVINEIHHKYPYNTHIQWSSFLSENLHYEYNYLSSLFSATAGITLEQFIIRQKMEKVKELLFYDELSVKEIAYKLGFSSVAHLSNQFKKVIGMSPSVFKKNFENNKTRTELDKIVK